MLVIMQFQELEPEATQLNYERAHSLASASKHDIDNINTDKIFPTLNKTVCF